MTRTYAEVKHFVNKDFKVSSRINLQTESVTMRYQDDAQVTLLVRSTFYICLRMRHSSRYCVRERSSQQVLFLIIDTNKKI